MKFQGRRDIAAISRRPPQNILTHPFYATYSDDYVPNNLIDFISIQGVLRPGEKHVQYRIATQH